MPWRALQTGVLVCHPIQGVPAAEWCKGWKAGMVYECDVCGKLWLLCCGNRGMLWFWKLIVLPEEREVSNTHATTEDT